MNINKIARAATAALMIGALMPISSVLATQGSYTIVVGSVNGISSYSCSTSLTNPVTITGSGTSIGSGNSVSIDWGDGNTSSNLGTFSGNGNNVTFTYTGSHTYATSGSHSVTVKLNNGTVKATATISVCTAPTTGTLTVVKHVVNDNGGTAAASGFSLHVKSGSTDVSNSPAAGSESGTVYTLAPGTYTVSEDANASYAGSFSGSCNGSGSVTVTAGSNATCTLTNDDIAPTTGTLKVIKHVINDNGGGSSASGFSLHVKSDGTDVTGSPAAGSETGTSYVLPAGSYTVSEGSHEGYSAAFSGSCNSDGAVTVTAGGTVTCTLTNDDIAIVPTTGTLVVIKHVVNDDEAQDSIASDFNLHVKSDGTDVAGSPASGSESGTAYTLAAGSYTVSEDTAAGYTSSFSGDCGESGIVSVTAGATSTCTMVNDDIAPPAPDSANVNVTVSVNNTFGGTAVAGDFTFSVTNTNSTPSTFAGSTGGTLVTIEPGPYSIGLLNGVIGYSSVNFSTGCSGTAADGDSAQCDVTINQDEPINVVATSSVAVTTIVINDNGGSATSSDATITVNGTNAVPGTFPGSETPVSSIFDAGAYTVTGSSLDGYSEGYSEGCSGTLGANDSASCTITYDDVQQEGGDRATLIVRKDVINDSGDGKVASDFTMNVSGSNVSSSSFPGDSEGTVITLDPGAYSVTEVADRDYTATIGSACSGNIESGQVVTCVITNDDKLPGQRSDGNHRDGTSGGRINPPGEVLGASTQGEVLGASTTCEPLLTSYLKMGANNPVDQVKALQGFLNDHESAGLTVSGFFGALTKKAVMAFQLKYADDVLVPWARLGLNDGEPTGYVYKTTQAKINNLVCADLNQVPQLP